MYKSFLLIYRVHIVREYLQNFVYLVLYIIKIISSTTQWMNDTRFTIITSQGFKQDIF